MAVAAIAQRQTSADIVFDALHEQIMSLDLLPGSKISEADIAQQFGVSRQPVREAFNRLGNMGFLQIKPQRATVVRKFSLETIAEARFIRVAVEIEMAKAAMANWSDAYVAGFIRNLSDQERAVRDDDPRSFHTLDLAFHQLIAEVAQTPFAFRVVQEKKALADRICVLSLKNVHEMQLLVDDHQTLYQAIVQSDIALFETRIRTHLSRIEKTISAVRSAHPDYFAL